MSPNRTTPYQKLRNRSIENQTNTTTLIHSKVNGVSVIGSQEGVVAQANSSTLSEGVEPSYHLAVDMSNVRKIQSTEKVFPRSINIEDILGLPIKKLY